MRKLLLSLALLVFAGTLVACNKTESTNTQGSTGESTQAKAKLVVGLECNYKPFNWTTDTKTDTAVKIDGVNAYCDGYDVKMAQLLATELDRELVIKALDWEGLIPALVSKNIDAIIAGMSPTSDRKLTIDFSDVYFRSEQVVIVKKTSPYANVTSVTGFTGAEITAQISTLQEGLVTQLTGATAATSLPDYNSLVTAVTAGTVDGFIAELPVAMQICSSNPSLKYIQFTQGNGFNVSDEEVTVSIGLRKADTQLKSEINAILATITLEQRNAWMSEFVNKSAE